MSQVTVAGSRTRRLGGSLITGCLRLLGATMATGQGSRPGREPHLPEAITPAPSWIGQAPFEVMAFFAMPPPAQNAAPLYLDAFFEFGEALAVGFPPEQRGRAAAAKVRGERIDRAYLMERVLRRTFEDGIALTVDANGRALEKRLDRETKSLYFLKVVEAVALRSDPSKQIDPRNLKNHQYMAKVQAQLDLWKPDFLQEHQALDDWARTLLSLPRASYWERLRKACGHAPREQTPPGLPSGREAPCFSP